jgi:hypothetical protein
VAASVDTFDITLQFPVGVQLFRDGIISGVSASMMQHRQRMSSVFPNEDRLVRRFTVTVTDAPVADYHRAVTLWTDSAGGCMPLDITLRGTDYASGAPATETIQVRMTDQPIALRSKSDMHYTFTLGLEEFGHAP